MRSIRTLTTWLAVGTFVFTFGATDAFAKKEKKSKETTETSEMVSIELTENAEADSKLFQPAMDLHNTLNDIETKLKDGNTAFLTALGVTEGTPFADALADLKAQAGGALTVEMDGMTPKVGLKTDADVPENVQSAVASLQSFVSVHIEAMEAAKQLPTQAQELVAAAQSIDPTALATEAASNPMQIPKVVKTINNNLKAIKTTPERVTNVTSTLATNVDAIKGLAN